MKIWAFPSFYPYDRPGMKWIGIFAHRQYNGLIDNGADIEVIQPVSWAPPFPISELSPDWKRSRSMGYPMETIYDGIKVHYPRIPSMKPSRFVKKSYEERYINTIINFFKNKKISLRRNEDIFYSQWLPDSVLVQEAAKRLGIKSAILSIGDDVLIWPAEKPQNKQLFTKLMNEADHRFACADYLGKETNKILGTYLSYDVINWGVNYDYFKPTTEVGKQKARAEYGLPPDKLIILNVGSAIVRKGWLDLLDALQKIKERFNNFTIVAVHAGPADIDLDMEASKRDLSANFINLGKIEPEKLNHIYNAADIFCLPSHWEGLANANIEAMSSGLPVITTNVCGHPELIKDDYNGILVAPKDTDMLGDKLLELMINSDLRTKLANNGRDFIVNKWGNYAHNSYNLLKALEKTVSESKDKKSP